MALLMDAGRIPRRVGFYLPSTSCRSTIWESLLKALGGLFHVLGEEERKIRTNPAAQVTDLLKKVFGK